MGRKKKFIDKKKSATFHILARDSSDPNYNPGPSGDRIFCRVDNNPYSVDGFEEGDEPNDGALDNNHGGIFDDAADDCDSEGNDFGFELPDNRAQKKPLPDHIRKEILELGFPDDGYNYLMHLREIKNTGGGSAYYDNPKAELKQIPHDVKAYDASRVDVSKVVDDNNDSNENLIYNVAAKTVGVRIQKAVDPEVAAMLDDSDLSHFGSDEEDLDEDFVIKANLPEESFDEQVEEKVKLVKTTEVKMIATNDLCGKGNIREGDGCFEEKARVRRAIDEQFDMLELKEYGSESEDDFNDYTYEENDCQPSLAEKLSSTFKLYSVDGSEVNGNQMIPSDLFYNKGMVDNEEPMESAPDVINRCREYAEKYENESPDEEADLFDESSSESEIWDCETIVSTYSNLDNHPGKIEVPGARRKKKLATIPEASNSSAPIISLKGKEKLPVDFLPNRGKDSSGKKERKKNVADEEESAKSKAEQLKRKQHGQESKEEKKERKAAVKEEKREARRAKKEMKELYKSEAHHAQKVAAFTGPSCRRLM
ncbi:PREDICTED: protein LTV1 homolog [Ipomoea nil]|uniref:protein LTV1 homolog n=1 Tax=Ipomoea nil TaxID=35883 RepID=UPI000900D3EA|nr:PREDICTED: protein LTV1 homolog [Ipomoea nil]XP_019153309.1 PREDICTED: protein LTV1 homolog [Ipomoea nil]